MRWKVATIILVGFLVGAEETKKDDSTTGLQKTGERGDTREERRAVTPRG